MAQAKVINNINHDGVAYKKGDTFEGDKETVNQLIEAGALRDPNAPKEDQSTDSAAEDKAKALVAQAEKALADAKDEAEKIRNDAKTDADKVAEAAKQDAVKVVADAKAEAEKIKKAAQSK
ncbi:hypothetical protein BJF87_21430 [Gordonia sp. CNJ-863]|uniref:DUF7210 family protein n=1 Tax=Gordonia sp. CNJ-863 TaxID=1904963 RepID=UPI0009650310|nr:hypothetical protein [Gordonia sp. CNJ-863]OLT47780.1 hypothetical protein BJF87_21430 [Gordonia sp. CNJ-863]